MSRNQEKFSFTELARSVAGRRTAINCTGVAGSERAHLLAHLFSLQPMPMAVVASNTAEAERFVEDLEFFFGSAPPPILFFPPYNIQPFKLLAYHNETAARRIRCLYQLMTGTRPAITVTTVAALLQKLIPRQTLSDFSELVLPDEELDREAFVAKLISAGYGRAVIVEEPGDFCVRGGLLDLFSPYHPDPVRIELYGDLVDSIRLFSADSQRTLETLEEAIVLPAREAVIRFGELSEIINRFRRQAALLDMPVTRVRTLVDQIRQQGAFPGIESLLPLIYDNLDTFLDYLGDRVLPVLLEPAGLASAADMVLDRAARNFAEAREANRICVEPEQMYLSWQDAELRLQQRLPLVFRQLAVSLAGAADNTPAVLDLALDVRDNLALTSAIRNPQDPDARLKPLAVWLSENADNGFSSLAVCRTANQAQRLEWLLSPYGIKTAMSAQFPLSAVDPEIDTDVMRICCGQLSSGFVWPAAGLALVTEDELFGFKHHTLKRPTARKAAELISFGDLKQGDLVVHDEHGIGCYEGLVKLKLDGTTNDFILILYRDEDKLYLPVDRLSMIQKYMGVDGIEPALDKMGGKSWERIRKRVKRSAEKIAGELLKLYAVRKVREGIPFHIDQNYLRHFETKFEYEETEDQLRAIVEVLRDMESPTPMDRLVCGDVGYGKTEVALRASFVAVNEGRQVAILVPTTVLAEQHYETFSRRFDPYPVRIACLSRFRPSKDQRRIVKELKDGTLDIVIGTHRLLQKDVGFKRLGLIILDEEQRFGVKHKERLKQFRQTVDVLALTATPIPRTLHLSLTGVRDISVISTPPEHRRPIITYVSEYDETVIKEAVERELGRQGQVFFVHNNIADIRRVAARLAELAPGARIDVAHGQMDEEALEKVMMAFMHRETDLLVCTSIIESGLDIPAANTIVINRADRFGLAQIYQLRGRVGRADEQAYAYLFIPRESALSRDAGKRLKVLMEHSDLGSGFQIAMSDLKIRGGGTILGASQSGHIAAVGYDMFLKLMQESIAELKGEPVVADLEPEININLSAYLPADYIPDIDQRLLSYRRMAEMSDLKNLAEFKREMSDRFGTPPQEANNLLVKIMLKIMAIRAGVKRLDVRDGHLFLYFSPAHQRNPHALIGLLVHP